MNACREHRRTVRAAIDAGEAFPAGTDKEHTAVCRKCRKDDDDLRAILAGAEAVRERDRFGHAGRRLGRPVRTDRRPRGCASPGTESRRRAAPPRRVWGFGPLLAGAAAGLVVGVLAAFLYLRRGPQASPAAPIAATAEASGTYAASGDFLQRVELEMAKRETIDYLEKSEYVLLDLLEPRPPMRPGAAAAAAAVTAGGASAERARTLLAKKRFFNAHLDDIRMAKARALCDQIEILFLELSQLQTELDPKQAAELRKYVEDKQLLLQIRLLKKELRGNEA